LGKAAQQDGEFYYTHSGQADTYWQDIFSRLLTIGTLFLVACTFFLLAYNSAYHIRWVVDGSMYPTLNSSFMDSDIVYVSKTEKGVPGDIIVINDAPPYNKAVIKRLIAVGGDELKLEWNGTKTIVYVNDQLIPEPYLNPNSNSQSEELRFNAFKNQSGWAVTPEPEITGSSVKIKIPDGYVFYMGDNRGYSYDCRAYGPIPAGQVLGRVDFIVFYGQNVLTKHLNIMLEPAVQITSMVLAPAYYFTLNVFNADLTNFLNSIGLGFAARWLPNKN